MVLKKNKENLQGFLSIRKKNVRCAMRVSMSFAKVA